ncbi:MAG: DegT/DnrJ/EryC1/StrS family aminotransferase [Bacteroidales bacterium]|nr:DegT/DnrJ/EryC1/StrS family aminotransferase [Candidatus Cryptobacteroides aphodequi]
MEFRDLGKQHERIAQSLDAAILKAASSCHYIMGPEVRELEARLAGYTGVSHCLSCGNGTDALTLALKAWGIGPGDAVFVPDFTFFASAEVIAAEGAVPIFVDVCEDTFNINPEDLEAAVREVEAAGKLMPRAVVAVDLFGLPADFPRIRAIADAHDLLILEDGAQGFGGSIEGKIACSFGDIATTSFFPAKPLGCYGDGGAVFTSNPEWAALIESYRVHGKGENKYQNVRIGLNSRLDTIQAAILLEKLNAFEGWELRDVNAAAEKYTARLKDAVKTPLIPEGYVSSWAQYTIRLESREQRDIVQKALKIGGIPSMVYYPLPMHAQKAFEALDRRECPVATRLCDTVLSLPMHPYLTEEQIETVSDAVIAAL